MMPDGADGAGMLVPPSPATYIPFGTATARSISRSPEGYVPAELEIDSPSSESEEIETPRNGETPSPPGVFISADEVVALQQWATEREGLCERLVEAEASATAREAEAQTLRERLAAAEAALGQLGLLAIAEDDERPVAPSVPEAVATTVEKPQQSASRRPTTHLARRSIAETNALASQRTKEVEQRKRQEVEELRAEYRRLRSACAEATAATAPIAAS